MREEVWLSKWRNNRRSMTEQMEKWEKKYDWANGEMTEEVWLSKWRNERRSMTEQMEKWEKKYDWSKLYDEGICVVITWNSESRIPLSLSLSEGVGERGRESVRTCLCLCTCIWPSPSPCSYVRSYSPICSAVNRGRGREWGRGWVGGRIVGGGAVMFLNIIIRWLTPL